MSDLARKPHEAAKKLVEELRAANENFGRRVSEEARTVGESARETAGRGTNTMEIHLPDRGMSSYDAETHRSQRD